MTILRLMIATLSLVSLAATASPRSMERGDAKQTEPVPMLGELQAATRARCALLAGPEYHECIYAVLMHRPMRPPGRIENRAVRSSS